MDGEFGQPDVYKLLRARYPEAGERIQKASIATTLTSLVKKGFIEVTHPGYGSNPRRYKLKR